MKNKIIKLFVGFLLLFMLGLSFTFILYKTQPKLSHRIYHYCIRYTRTQPHTEIVFSRNSPYAQHIKAARSYKHQPVSNNNDVKLYLKQKKLVNVKNGIGYKLSSHMHHSAKVLTPEAFDVLKSLGRDFELKTGNKNDFFIVTSLTRTIENQQKLTKTNINATRNLSSHSFGCSFDISYAQFNRLRYSDKEFQNTLKDILISYQRDGRILVIKENKIRCFHITGAKAKLN